MTEKTNSITGFLWIVTSSLFGIWQGSLCAFGFMLFGLLFFYDAVASHSASVTVNPEEPKTDPEGVPP